MCNCAMSKPAFGLSVPCDWLVRPPGQRCEGDKARWRLREVSGIEDRKGKEIMKLAVAQVGKWENQDKCKYENV